MPIPPIVVETFYPVAGGSSSVLRDLAWELEKPQNYNGPKLSTSLGIIARTFSAKMPKKHSF